MNSRTGRPLLVNWVLAIPFLFVGAATIVYPSRTQAQDKPVETQSKAKIELTTEPSPAQKGSNTVRVKLTDTEGKAISGAEVTVTFFMPAMPPMGMAEMKTVVKGTEKGPGTYEGKGDLGSGGIWQVTVTAQKNGKTIATSKLNVKAAGGM
jgi:membrane fusion protein, copper/silver efflux system